MTKTSIMQTAARVGRVVLAAAAMIGYSSVTVRAAGFDPLRCEALKLRCASRYHMCLARCDGIADRRAARSMDNAEEVRTNCSNSCDLRHARMQVRLDHRRVCATPPDPVPVPTDPQTCAAKLLWTKANYIQCMGRCYARFDQRPAFDCDDCVSACYDEYHAANEDTTADPICGDGPADPVSEEEPPTACTATD